MKTVAGMVRFLVYSNIYISICVVCFTIKTSLILFGDCGNVHVNLLAFFATLFLYGFHKAYRRFRFSEEEHKEDRHHWVDAHMKPYYVIIIIALAGAVSQLIYMPLRVWVLLCPVGIMAGGYSIPFIKTNKGFIRLRDVLWLKALWIGLAYAWLTTFLPIAFVLPVRQLLSTDVLFMFIRNLVFVFVLVIPFDIRDIKYDVHNGMKTLPVLLGIKGAIKLALWLLLVFAITVFAEWYFMGFNTYIALALCISAIEAVVVIPFSKPERPNLFFPLAIESAMIIQCALVFAAVHLA